MAPFKRKFNKKVFHKRRFKKKRNVSGRQHKKNLFAPIGRLRKYLEGQMMTYVKMLPNLPIFSTQMSYSPAVVSWTLSQQVELTILASQYQFYRFARVVLKGIPLISETVLVQAIAGVTYTPGTITQPPNMLIAHNRNGDTVAPTPDAMRARQDTKIYSSMKPFTYTVMAPNPLMRVYESTLTSGYADAGPKWISTNDTVIPHYGLKYVIEASTYGPDISPINFGWNVEVIFVVEFKDPI